MMPVRIKIKDDIWGKERVSGHSCSYKLAFWTRTIKFAVFLPDTFASTNSCLILFWLFLFSGFSSGKRMLKCAEAVKTEHPSIALSLCLQHTCEFLHAVSSWEPLHQPHRGTFATWILYWLSQLPCDVTHLESVSSNKPPLEKKNAKHCELIHEFKLSPVCIWIQ